MSQTALTGRISIATALVHPKLHDVTHMSGLAVGSRERDKSGIASLKAIDYSGTTSSEFGDTVGNAPLAMHQVEKSVGEKKKDGAHRSSIQGLDRMGEDLESKDSGLPSEHSPVDEFVFPAPVVSDDAKQNDETQSKRNQDTVSKRKRKSLVGVPGDLKRQRRQVHQPPVQQQQQLTPEAPTPTFVRRKVVVKDPVVIKKDPVVTFQKKKKKNSSSSAAAAKPASDVRTSRRKAAIAASHKMKKNKNDWCSDDDDDEDDNDDGIGQVLVQKATTIKAKIPPQQTPPPPPPKQQEQEKQVKAPSPSTSKKPTPSSEKVSRKKRLQAVIDAHRNTLAQSLISPEPGNTANHSRMVKQQITPEQPVQEQKPPPLTLGDLHDLSSCPSDEDTDEDEKTNHGLKKPPQPIPAGAALGKTPPPPTASIIQLQDDQEDVNALHALNIAIQKAVESQSTLSDKICHQKLVMLRQEMTHALEQAHAAARHSLSQSLHTSQASCNAAIGSLHSKISEMDVYFQQQKQSLDSMRQQCHTLQANAQQLLDSGRDTLQHLHQKEMHSLSQLHDSLFTKFSSDMKYIQSYREKMTPIAVPSHVGTHLHR